MTVFLRAGGIRGYAALMRDIGHDPLPLLRRHRIRLKSLDDEDTLLPLRSVVHLMEATATEANCGDFGLRMARAHDVSILGPLGVAMQNAWTFKDAIDYTSRFLFLQSPGLVVSYFAKSEFDDRAAEVSIDIVLDPRPPLRQSIDLSLGSAHRISQLLAGEHYKLRAVTLPHTPVVSLAVYQRFFGARVIPGQERASLHIDRATFREKLRSTNPALREIAEDYLSSTFGIQTIASRPAYAWRSGVPWAFSPPGRMIWQGCSASIPAPCNADSRQKAPVSRRSKMR